MNQILNVCFGESVSVDRQGHKCYFLLSKRISVFMARSTNLKYGYRSSYCVYCDHIRCTCGCLGLRGQVYELSSLKMESGEPCRYTQTHGAYCCILRRHNSPVDSRNGVLLVQDSSILNTSEKLTELLILNIITKLHC
jgi:hypothetical protein